MEQSSKVLYDQDGPVVTIRLNRPAVHNAVDAEMARGLYAAWQRFRDDESAFVAVLAGSGKSFSAGADLKDVARLYPEHESQDGQIGIAFTQIRDIYKPTIAAIRGHCVGGGLEMALWCDIRIAGTDAKFGFLERRFGLPLLDGGTQRLSRAIGLGPALELVITGRQITAQEALAIDLITEIVPEDEVLPHAKALAHQIAQLPQAAIRSDKKALLDGRDLPLEQGLALERQVGLEVLRQVLRERDSGA